MKTKMESEATQAMKKNPILAVRDAARAREGAFTLMELMVVIATLAVLATLVLPALARPDDNGARMVCINNLRQMGTASGMYAADNRDFLPQPNWDGGNNSSAPRGWLYSMSSAQGLPVAYPSGQVPNPYSTVAPYNLRSDSRGAWQSGLWFQYVQNPRSYLCPADIESTDYLPLPGIGRVNKLSSYVMNGAAIGYSTSWPTPCKVTDVWSPACYLLWEPDENAVGLGNPGAFEYNDGANFPNTSEGIGRLHSANSGNMLCVGGNVQFVTVQTFQIQSIAGKGPGPGGNTLAWWYPFASTGN